MQDLRRDTSTVDWRIRVKRSDEDLDLGIDALLLVCRFAADGEGTNALTIKTLDIVSYQLGEREVLWPGYHVLGKTLSKTELMALGLEISDCKGIFLGIAASKALVCHVEKWVMVLLLYYVADLPPLCF